MNDKADELFLQAREIPDPEGRASFLSQACQDDPDLLAHIQGLLANEAQADSFFAEAASDDKGQGRASSVQAVTDDLPAEREGQSIGHYELLEKIGEGGCGVVYEAEQR